MKHTNKYSQLFYLLALSLLVVSCQKYTRPSLGNYPKDSNPPGGPLKFYAAFDGSSSSSLLNAVDSIRADFPSDNPLQFGPGISGKAIIGNGTGFVKYAGANDFVSTAGSFTISFWEKRNGIPKGNSAFFFCFASSNGYWAGASMLGLFDWGTNNDSAAIKIDCIDSKVSDNWFQWVGPTAVHGIMNNQWHHLAFVYDASTSVMTLYVDGSANPNTQSWPSHGAASMDNSKITEFDVAGNSNIPNMGWGQNWEAGNMIDQFRLYGTALTSAQVMSLYTNKQ
ncbi:MAG: LamG domain-containing protein [Bacteroidota bacterium]|nr:LamG domain-containing protein [Bacteroidota bacterium]MDP4217513.1 LamG domain-containing protein [Bacteroidota bacterium]MDP4246992.1 LamG domain-containing protein [Bacteroidota bacterium]MDP4255108.1 LamG domain-containing protein [Bacteroidota bacterium]MDP4260576.1 LamG domain-containing protein [Bacteroidota bacterium]